MPNARLTMTIAGALLVGLPLPTLAAAPAPLQVAEDAPLTEASPEDPLAQLRPAYAFGRTLYTMATRRAEAPALNTLSYQTKADDPRPLGLDHPNADLLHATAWLDLSQGPVILTLPAIAGRYHSVAIHNMQTDVLALLGTRTGSQGGSFALINTDYQGPLPEGASPLRLACNSCRLVARVLHKGAQDAENANAALAGITLEADPATMVAPPLVPQNPVAATWLEIINTIAASEGETSPIAQKAKALQGLAEPVEVWDAALPALTKDFNASLADGFERINGWDYPGFMVADATADDMFRAQMAEAAPDALPRVEAMVIETREDASAQPLNGANAYRLRLPYNLPIGGFWSVSMYQIGTNGDLEFVPNEYSRFAVGDRSDHLRADRNGSLELFIQAGKPQGERSVNWLPAPNGPFALIFRAYLPKSEMLDGSFRLAAVTKAEPLP